MPHPWWYTVRALALVGLSAAWAAAQTPATASPPASSGGSVLRLMSGIEGLEPEPDATSGPEPDVVIESAPDDLPLDSMSSEPAAPHHWVHPHAIGGRRGVLGQDWKLFPSSMVPIIGTRTPSRYRHQNLGEPLRGASWLNRPFGAGWFAGGITGTPLMGNHVNQSTGFFGGYRLTWDYDYYWGLETRVGAATTGLHDVTRPTIPRTGDLVQWDADLLYYPWGDSRWRPYVMVGLGIATFHFSDDNDVYYRHSLVALPWGVGLKYRVHEYLVARLDLIDNWAIGGGPLSSMQNISYTCGIEVRFGGVRRHYWPWNPGRHLW